MIEFFIDVAQECFNIGNFNSLMAIISECGLQTSVDLWPQFRCVLTLCSSAGMNMSPVARLKKTWNKVNTDKFEILEVSGPGRCLREAGGDVVLSSTILCPAAAPNGPVQ